MREERIHGVLHGPTSFCTSLQSTEFTRHISENVRALGWLNMKGNILR